LTLRLGKAKATGVTDIATDQDFSVVRVNDPGILQLVASAGHQLHRREAQFLCGSIRLNVGRDDGSALPVDRKIARFEARREVDSSEFERSRLGADFVKQNAAQHDAAFRFDPVLLNGISVGVGNDDELCCESCDRSARLYNGGYLRSFRISGSESKMIGVTISARFYFNLVSIWEVVHPLLFVLDDDLALVVGSVGKFDARLAAIF